MSGGDVKLGGWGGKVFRAPTPRQQKNEIQKRNLRELEARKIKEIKHEEKHLREHRRLEQRAMRANNHALGVELGSGGLLGGAGGLLGGGNRLYRSRSVGHLGGGGLGRGIGVGGIGSPMLGGIGSPMIGGGGLLSRGGMGRERMERERLERERKQLELERVRSERRRIEEEARRRTRTASMLRNERAQLANLNSALLASPGRSLLGSPRMVGSPMMSGSPYLGAGLSPGYGAGAGLRRVRSFSSAPLGAMGLGHHHHVQQSPKVLPIPVPIPQQSPRPIVNYNTYNVSPHGHSPHLHSHHGSPLMGGLGGFDDLNIGGGFSAGPGMIDPPLFPGGGSFGRSAGAMFPSSPRMGGYSPARGTGMMMGGHSPRLGAMPGAFGGDGIGMGIGPGMGMGMGAGMGMGMAREVEFFIEEGAVPAGHIIRHRIGPVFGRSAAGIFGSMDDGELFDMAVSEMARQAQMQGANGVVSFRVDNDESGAPIAIGEAVVVQ